MLRLCIVVTGRCLGDGRRTGDETDTSDDILHTAWTHNVVTMEKYRELASSGRVKV
jgi:hypothetical protein